MSKLLNMPALKAAKTSFFRKKQIKYAEELQRNKEEIEFQQELYEKAIEAQKKVMDAADMGKNSVTIVRVNEVKNLHKCAIMEDFAKVMNSKGIFPYSTEYTSYSSYDRNLDSCGCNLHFYW